MGIATFLVAFVPTYEQIGIWGAVLLTVLRFIQGVGVGGEWGGSVLLSMEWAQDQPASRLHRVVAAVRRAGRAVPRQSRGAGVQRLSGDAVPDLGLAHPVPAEHRAGRRSDSISGSASWRRRSSRGCVAEKRIERAPMLEVIRRQPQARSCCPRLARMGEQAPFYIFIAFVFTYGTATLQHARATSCWSAVLDARRSLSFFIDPVLRAICPTASAASACT